MERIFDVLKTIELPEGGSITVKVARDAPNTGYWMDLTGVKIGLDSMAPLLEEMRARGAVVVVSHNKGTQIAYTQTLKLKSLVPTTLQHVIVVSDDDIVAALSTMLGVFKPLSEVTPVKTAAGGPSVQIFGEKNLRIAENLFWLYLEMIEGKRDSLDK